MPWLVEAAREAVCLRGAAAFFTLSVKSDPEFAPLFDRLSAKGFLCVDPHHPTSFEALHELRIMHAERGYPYPIYIYARRIKRAKVGAELKDGGSGLFHPKVLLFDMPGSRYRLLVGSHNLSKRALLGRNIELSAVFEGERGDELYEQAVRILEEYKSACIPLEEGMVWPPQPPPWDPPPTFDHVLMIECVVGVSLIKHAMLCFCDKGTTWKGAVGQEVDLQVFWTDPSGVRLTRTDPSGKTKDLATSFYAVIVQLGAVDESYPELRGTRWDEIRWFHHKHGSAYPKLSEIQSGGRGQLCPEADGFVMLGVREKAEKDHQYVKATPALVAGLKAGMVWEDDPDDEWAEVAVPRSSEEQLKGCPELTRSSGDKGLFHRAFRR